MRRALTFGLAPACAVLGIAVLDTSHAQNVQPSAPATATAPASEPAAAAAKPHARIVVTFANTIEGSPPSPGSTGGPRYGGANYVIGQSAHALARRVASEYSLTEVASWPIKALSVHCVVYEIPDERSAQDVLARLAHDARISLAQPLQELHTLSDGASSNPPYNDPLYDLQTNLTELGIERAHARTRGAGVRVGLIDTGVDTKHPDLRGRIVGTHSFVAKPAQSARSYRHGTAMAGLIAAVADNHIGIVGVAPLAQIEVFEACWQLRPDADEAVCNSFTVAKALGAAIDRNDRLINLSVAGPADPLLAELVKAGIRRGMTFVGAAAEPSDAFPGGIPGVIVAGSTEHLSWPAMLTAPAGHVFTLRPDAQYDFESGTSVAAAEVTGAIALLMSASHAPLDSRTIGAILTHSSSGILPVGTTSSPPAPAALDINGALQELDVEQHRVATRASQRR